MENPMKNPTEYLISLDSKSSDEIDSSIVTNNVYNQFHAIDWDIVYSHYENKTSLLAIYLLGKVYEYKEDYEKAKNYYEIGVEKGDSMSIHSFGCLYRYGLGVLRDYDKAKYYYEMGVEKGHAFSMNNLGDLYRSGLGVSQDYTKAKYYYEMAIEKGNASAINNLGYIYHYGQGIPKDYEKAKHYYVLAAKKGCATALNNLGYMYKDDEGVAKNYEKAKHYYEMAIEKGNTAAIKNLVNLITNNIEQYIKDTKEQKKELQKLREENAELRLLPDAPDYLKAKEHFETSASK